MKRTIAVALLAALVILPAEAGTRVRVRKGPAGRTRVVVHTTRPAPVVRVTPRVHLAPVTFGAVVVTTVPTGQVWRGSETIERSDGWTEFVMNVDRRGDRMLLEIDRGAAQISTVQLVFDNGDAQLVDFNDRTHGKGVYSLIEFKDGRKIDHVRVIAKATTAETAISLHLVT